MLTDDSITSKLCQGQPVKFRLLEDYVKTTSHSEIINMNRDYGYVEGIRFKIPKALPNTCPFDWHFGIMDYNPFFADPIVKLVELSSPDLFPEFQKVAINSGGCLFELRIVDEKELADAVDNTIRESIDEDRIINATNKRMSNYLQSVKNEILLAKKPVEYVNALNLSPDFSLQQTCLYVVYNNGNLPFVVSTDLPKNESEVANIVDTIKNKDCHESGTYTALEVPPEFISELKNDVLFTINIIH